MDSLQSRSHGLIGQSPRLRYVVQMVEKLGHCRWPALLLGETGTGKELVARAIHNVRGEGPFVPIDCSAISGSLLESELFGHVKGAFTGATANKTGLIELAHGGTAFFDEIGELPLEFQAKLLRVLQEKEFRPVGSTRTRISDFRVIAATNRDLAKEVEKGTFRRDLFYRLNVVPVRLSPLRDRREDIPLLVYHFLEQYGRQQVLELCAIEALASYEWPGNVRELLHCVQHLVAIHSGPSIRADDLPGSIRENGSQPVPLPQAPSMMPHYDDTAETRSMAAAASSGAVPAPRDSAAHYNIPLIPLIELERRAIEQALAHSRGDRSAAAQMLGIGRTTLYRKIKEYGLAI